MTMMTNAQAALIAAATFAAPRFQSGYEAVEVVAARWEKMLDETSFKDRPHFTDPDEKD